MDKAYSTYRIQVVSRERVRVDKRNSQNQSISDEPPRNLQYQRKIELITELVKKARDNQLNKAEPIKELGEALFDLLFDDAGARDFTNFYDEVVQQNIPVVVAMQYLVRINIANKFTRCFYERLAEGYPVDIAAQLGRLAIALEPPHYKRRDFVTPVIFMRGQDGYLFQRSEIQNELMASEKSSSLDAKFEDFEAENADITGNQAEELRGTNASAEFRKFKITGGKIIGNNIGKGIGASVTTKMDEVED